MSSVRQSQVEKILNAERELAKAGSHLSTTQMERAANVVKAVRRNASPEEQAAANQIIRSDPSFDW